MLELAVTRLFSATMYYHYAFMAISLALFGSGASGVFIYLVQRRLSEARTGTWLALASVLMALSVPLAVYVILHEPLSNDLGGTANYFGLARIYTAAALPFFFAGCVVTLSITRLAGDVARLYLFDLAGAATGCLLLIPVLNAIGAINTLLFVAAVAALAGVVFTTATGSGGRAMAGLCLAGAVGFVSLAAYNHHTGWIDVRKAKGWQEENVLFSKWNSFSRITVSGKPAEDAHLQIRIDSDAGTTITRNAAETALHEGHRRDIEAIPYHLVPDARVLIIGPGGGNDVMKARLFGPKQITAVEVNPIIARDVMGSEPFRSFSGDLFRQPGVKLVVAEGRSFIRGNPEKYDLIQGTMVDTWAATAAGAFALTESNLYTVEAFREYADHLTDDGILTMTRWYFEPPDQMLRLVSLTRAMMEEENIGDPAEHIMVLRGPDVGGLSFGTFLFKKSPFTADDVQTVETIAGETGVEILYSPGTRPPNVFTQLIEASNPAEVWDNFVSNIAPPRDNNPFFFNTIRPGYLLDGMRGAEEWRKSNLGSFVLFALLFITGGLVLLFIIGPLFVARRRDLTTGTRRKLAHLLYFACLGAGFIIVEVAMIQKFILFLGHPVYALAVVLFSLLLFSGMGSWLSGRIEGADLRPPLVKVLVGLAALVVVYILVLPPIFYNLVQLGLPARILIAVVLMAPLALMMGMPMPTGIRILARSSPEMIPWAWGVNGATSVMGSVAALVIAILTGFNQALIVGAALYLGAILFVARPERRPDPVPVAAPQPAAVNV